MNPLEQAGYNRLESKDLKEWWSRWNENGSCDQIQIRKGGSIMLDIQPEELKLVTDYVNQNQSVFDSVQDKVHAQKMLNSTFGMNTTDLLKTLKIQKPVEVFKKAGEFEKGIETNTADTNYVEVQCCNNCKQINYKNNGSEKYCNKGRALDDPTICLDWERREQPSFVTTSNAPDELLGDYIITDKGELALKDKEIADLKQQLKTEKFWSLNNAVKSEIAELTRRLERLHDENQENKDGFTYWFEKHNEMEEERNDLQKSLESKDVQITALSEEVKYLTNGCELLAKNLKAPKRLIDGIRNAVEVQE